jgi:cellulose synthase (UDP-forming)
MATPRRIQRITHILRILLIISIIAIMDYLVITYFNTLLWPNLWPVPALVIVGVGLALFMWFPEIGRSVWTLRLAGVFLIFTGHSYLIESLQIALEQPTIVGWAHLIGFSGVFVVLLINYINQLRPRDNKTAPPLPATLPYVALVVPTYGEPYEVVEKTVVSLKKMDYPKHLTAMAEGHGVLYNAGPQKDAKAGNLNSALRFLERAYPQAELVLTQDADEVVHPSLLKKVVGYFSDPNVAFVQTPKEVLTPKADPFGTRDRIFFDILQVGRNGCNAAFACGSGVVWRIQAVKSIGGFVIWNVVEDLTTSYWLHSAGYRSEYHNEKLSVGLAPDDIPGLLKQRGTWAVDTWRLFLFDNPLFKRGLTFAQRLQYLELGMFYLMSTFFMPLLMFVPIISLLTGVFVPISASVMLPWMTVSVLYYVVLSRGQSLYILRMWQYLLGHWPTYTKAFFLAVRSRFKKPKYVVTRKTRDSGFYAHYLWAQFLYLVLGTVAIIYTLFAPYEVVLETRLINIGILLFFMFMMSGICRAAFYGRRPIDFSSASKFFERDANPVSSKP